MTTPTKGNRSRRRRSAKMKSQGYVHVSGTGWRKSHGFLTAEMASEHASQNPINP